MKERIHNLFILLGLRPARKDSVRSSEVLANLRIHGNGRSEAP